MNDDQEKSALNSKKFIAFLAVSLGFFILMGMMVWPHEIETLGENFAFMVLVVTQGFLAVGYILGQASLDRYIRVAKITMGRGNGNGSNGGKVDEK